MIKQRCRRLTRSRLTFLSSSQNRVSVRVNEVVLLLSSVSSFLSFCFFPCHVRERDPRKGDVRVRERQEVGFLAVSLPRRGTVTKGIEGRMKGVVVE